MSGKIRISVDAMGGDFAPANEIDGSILAVTEKPSLEIILVGKEDVIKNELSKQKSVSQSILERISVVNADEVITMEDSPTDTFKTKPNSSLAVALTLQKSKEAEGTISAGNTGAVLTNSLLKLGRLKGVGRPTIGSIFPTSGETTMVFDVGASVDCKPKHLYEFAVMGSVYMEIIYNIQNPKVALLSVGEEKSKGKEVTFEAYELLEKSKLNFVGNVEGSDILKGKVNLIICDGFEGNVILKFAEGVLSFLKSSFKDFAEKSFTNKLKMGMMQGTLRTILSEFDYQKYGGVPLLGVNGVSIIGHGKSTPLAIKNMIFKAEEMIRKDVNMKIEQELADFK
jgi:glycerol-3-phosphate acyltransferase PlsX